MRLHIDGKLVGEEPITFLTNEHRCWDNLKRINFIGNDGKLDGYVYHAQVLPISASITDQFVKVRTIFFYGANVLPFCNVASIVT